MKNFMLALAEEIIVRASVSRKAAFSKLRPTLAKFI